MELIGSCDWEYPLSNKVEMITPSTWSRDFYPFKHQPHKMVRHTQAIRRQKPCV